MNLPDFLKKDKATFKSVLLNNLLLNNTFERFFATLLKACKPILEHLRFETL